MEKETKERMRYRCRKSYNWFKAHKGPLVSIAIGVGAAVWGGLRLAGKLRI